MRYFYIKKVLSLFPFPARSLVAHDMAPLTLVFPTSPILRLCLLLLSLGSCASQGGGGGGFSRPAGQRHPASQPPLLCTCMFAQDLKMMSPIHGVCGKISLPSEPSGLVAQSPTQLPLHCVVVSPCPTNVGKHAWRGPSACIFLNSKKCVILLACCWQQNHMCRQDGGCRMPEPHPRWGTKMGRGPLTLATIRERGQNLFFLVGASLGVCYN